VSAPRLWTAYLAPEVRGFSMRLRSPRERTVPERLKPDIAVTIYGTAEAVPFRDRVLTQTLKAVPFKETTFSAACQTTGGHPQRAVLTNTALRFSSASGCCPYFPGCSGYSG
jgi:hypothetical protein